MQVVENVIWGVDFGAKPIPKAELSTLELMAVDVFGMLHLQEPIGSHQSIVALNVAINALRNAEYVAPTDDCA